MVDILHKFGRPQKASGDDGDESLGAQRTDLAFERSAEAANRTLMAAVRTAVSMISFGFTIAKFFEYLAKLGVLGEQRHVGQGPHHLGLVLLGGGTLTLVLALVEYLGYVHRLRRESGDKLHMSTALFSAIFVLSLGVFGSIVIALDLASQ